MPGAVIVADQLSGAGTGVPGVARNDLWLNRAITLYVGTSGNTSYQWTLLAKPSGSGAALSTPTGATSGFNPDLRGTYRIQLVTNGGGAGNVQILVFRVRYDHSGALLDRGWAYPAFAESAGEANYGGNAIGYAEVLEFILEDIRTALEGAGGVTFAGDLSGSTSSQTVLKIHGTSVPATPTADQALLASSGTAAVWGFITNANIDPDAVIDGSKVVANFSGQDIYGDNAHLNGDVIIESTLILSDYAVVQYLKTDGAGNVGGTATLPFTDIRIGSQATGDFVYAASATTWARLSTPAYGYSLRSNGVGAAPIYDQTNRRNVVPITTSATLTQTQGSAHCLSTGSGLTVTLPPSTSAVEGQTHSIKSLSTSTKDVTVASSLLIDGLASVTLQPGEALLVEFHGSGESGTWLVV